MPKKKVRRVRMTLKYLEELIEDGRPNLEEVTKKLERMSRIPPDAIHRVYR